MTILYLLRHAESEGNVNPAIYATTFNHDICLSEYGKEQAEDAAILIGEDMSSGMPATIFSSPYKRTLQTAEIISEHLGQGVVSNLFLSERQIGEQEGCNEIDSFAARPMERYAYEKAGHLAYTPLRGESFMDLQMRVGLFMLQHESFRHIPFVVVVSHRDACLALHSYLTGETPTPESKWKNCEIRKYAAIDSPNRFTYKGVLV